MQTLERKQKTIIRAAPANHIRILAGKGVAGSPGRLPHIERIQRSFGLKYDLRGVKASVGGKAESVSRQLGARAFTIGDQVAFSGRPTLHTAAHEAAHVVQQRAGIKLNQGIGAKGDMHERHADAVADAVVAGRNCENLLNSYATDINSQSFFSPGIQFLQQNLPYVGPLISYLNPRNQLLRAVLPGLSDSQERLLDSVFGSSLSTSIIRLSPNSLLATGGCYRTIGNIIHMPGPSINDHYLIHEAAHVWQHQNTMFGVGYAVSALRAMAIAQVLGGDWQRAYDYRNMVRYRIPWRFWNAEQQATWITDNRRLPSGWMLEGALPNFGVESGGIE